MRALRQRLWLWGEQRRNTSCTWWFQYNNNKLQFANRSLTGENDVLVGTALVNDGLWHHVVAVYDGRERSIYIDGVLDASAGAPNAVSLSGTNRCRCGWAPSGAMTGPAISMRQALYNRALSRRKSQGIYQVAIAANGADDRIPAGITDRVCSRTVTLSMAAFRSGAVVAINGTRRRGHCRAPPARP